MTLYINVTNLSRFEELYRKEEKLQCAIERETGIRWSVDNSADIEEIEKKLIANKIIHQWDE